MGSIGSVLLSTDYVPRAITETLRNVWDCRVFNHYGMTETGLGGGVECEALDGYHLRDADLYFEVVDHESGEAVADGTTGEVVFTTLTRRGMPLIRYKTGDMAGIVPQPCPCGTFLRRMERVRGRWESGIRLGPESTLTLPDMDEALFRLPGLLDYRATVSQGREGTFRLHVDVHRAEGAGPTECEVLRDTRRTRRDTNGCRRFRLGDADRQFPRPMAGGPRRACQRGGLSQRVSRLPDIVTQRLFATFCDKKNKVDIPEYIMPY